MFLFRCLLPSVSVYMVLISPSHAHFGHLGDLAGHSHWIGLGAVVVAGALAGLVGKLSDNKDTDEIGAEAEDETQVEGNPA